LLLRLDAGNDDLGRRRGKTRATHDGYEYALRRVLA
jgi:hypothetical protein